MQFKYWIAGLLNALLGQVAIMMVARWIFENPHVAATLVDKRLSQIEGKES